jgi:transketolase
MDVLKLAVKLSDKIWDNPALVATRDGFGMEVARLAENDSRIVGLSGDLNDSVKLDWLREKHPDRFFQAGIAEQDMVGMAAGLCLAGCIPFAATFGAFMIRAMDQIRVSVAFSNLNVKLAATHCGVTTGEDGGNAQMLEDIAMLRCLPNMRVLVPCDSLEATRATRAAVGIVGPAYIRLGREKIPVLTTEETPFEVGKAEVFADGSDVAIIACGLEVYQSLAAARMLAKEGISARVLNLHTIKPIDSEAIVACARECGAIVTAEEHQIAGGMGSAVAEVLAQRSPAPVEMVGVADKFGTSGKGTELMEKFGLTAPFIAEAAKRAVARKM